MMHDMMNMMGGMGWMMGLVGPLLILVLVLGVAAPAPQRVISTVYFPPGEYRGKRRRAGRLESDGGLLLMPNKVVGSSNVASRDGRFWTPNSPPRLLASL
jgi:hypothetical protein